MLILLLAFLSCIGVIVCVALAIDVIKHRKELAPETSWYKCGIIGFTTNFFDALGIGSFATTTALLRLFKQTRDKTLPGTLNVACAIPALLEAIIYIEIIRVDFTTLISMIIAAGVGAWLGSSIVIKLPEFVIQLTVSIALFIASALILATAMHWLPLGGELLGLPWHLLIIAIAGNFVLGALGAAGVGFFAPCMALVYVLGMSARVAFPIMTGSCAIQILSASLKFILAGAYNRKAAVAIGIAGSIGVIIATTFVREIPTTLLRWLVIIVIFYTAAILFNAGYRSLRRRRIASGHIE